MVLTDASDRQDNARVGSVANYYYAYRYFALKDRNPVYAAVCRLIEADRCRSGLRGIFRS